MNKPNPEDLEGLRQLFPEFTEEELKEADERIERYLAFALEVYEESVKEPVRLAEFLRRLREEA